MREATKFELYDSTGHWLFRLSKAMTDHFQRLLNPYGLIPGEWNILSSLYHRRARSPGEISAYIGKTPAAVTKLLDSLERKGLVVRRPGPNRRSLEVHLTQAGRAITPKIAALSRATNEHFLAILDREQRLLFQAALRKILESQGVRQQGIGQIANGHLSSRERKAAWKGNALPVSEDTR